MRYELNFMLRGIAAGCPLISRSRLTICIVSPLSATQRFGGIRPRHYPGRSQPEHDAGDDEPVNVDEVPRSRDPGGAEQAPGPPIGICTGTGFTLSDASMSASAFPKSACS